MYLYDERDIYYSTFVKSVRMSVFVCSHSLTLAFAVYRFVQLSRLFA